MALEIELRVRESELKKKENEEFLMRAELDTRRQELERVNERVKKEESRLIEELGLEGKEGSYCNRSEEAVALGGPHRRFC